MNWVPLVVPTLAGETAEEMASKVADAINADANLTQTGVYAFAIGSTVVTNGSITNRVVNVVALPSLMSFGLGLLAALLLTLTATKLRFARGSR